MRIKICGITNEGDLAAAVEAGADALGFNTVGGPRCLPLERLGELLECVPPFVSSVVLASVRDDGLDQDLSRLLAGHPGTWLQLYGSVDGPVLRRLHVAGFRTMTVARVVGPDFAAHASRLWSDDPATRPLGVVLDAIDNDREGGTGKAFHWQWLVQARARGELANWPPLVLAGGLTPANVADAIRTARPYGVDVSSGVEPPGAPGTKDRRLLREFVRNAHAAAETLLECGDSGDDAGW